MLLVDTNVLLAAAERSSKQVIATLYRGDVAVVRLAHTTAFELIP